MKKMINQIPSIAMFMRMTKKHPQNHIDINQRDISLNDFYQLGDHADGIKSAWLGETSMTTVRIFYYFISKDDKLIVRINANDSKKTLVNYLTEVENQDVAKIIICRLESTYKHSDKKYPYPECLQDIKSMNCTKKSLKIDVLENVQGFDFNLSSDNCDEVELNRNLLMNLALAKDNSAYQRIDQRLSTVGQAFATWFEKSAKKIVLPERTLTAQVDKYSIRTMTLAGRLMITIEHENESITFSGLDEEEESCRLHISNPECSIKQIDILVRNLVNKLQTYNTEELQQLFEPKKVMFAGLTIG